MEYLNNRYRTLETRLQSANPFLIYLPFLFVYFLVVLVVHSDVMEGDEGRYYFFAENLLRGFYSPPPPNINLWNGPGYPIILMPFVALDLPVISITLLNAIFHYLSIVLLFLSLKRYISFRSSFLLTLIWGCYYLAYKEMTLIYTESFTTFLVTLIIFSIAKREPKSKDILTGGITFGFLVLTKIIFGYVLLVLLAASAVHYFFLKNFTVKHFTFLFIIAFALNVPYLLYTYSLTGKLFYWGNSGGMSLYWMSSPHKHEYGDWNTTDFDTYCFDPSLPCNAQMFAKNHTADIEYVLSLPPAEQDDAYKKIALTNIKENPLKYLKNCYANIIRMFFNIPESYTYPREMSLLRIPPNSILLTFMLIACGLTFIKWRHFPANVQYLVGILVLYLGASTLVSATHRQLNVVVPLIIFWIAYTLKKSVVVRPSLR